MDFICIEMPWRSGIIIYESKKIQRKNKEDSYYFFHYIFMWLSIFFQWMKQGVGF